MVRIVGSAPSIYDVFSEYAGAVFDTCDINFNKQEEKRLE